MPQSPKGPYFFRMQGNRIRLLHGPIELVMAAEGPEEICEAAYTRGWKRFQSILSELLADREALQSRLEEAPPEITGAIGQRILAACWPWRAEGLRPSEAACGAIAEDILEAMLPALPLREARVDCLGRTALWLLDSEKTLIDEPALPVWPTPAATVVLTFAAEARGIATLKSRGETPVTVTSVARRAAEADLAAALLAAAPGIDLAIRAADLLCASGLILSVALLHRGETHVIGARHTLLPHEAAGYILE